MTLTLTTPFKSGGLPMANKTRKRGPNRPATPVATQPTAPVRGPVRQPTRPVNPPRAPNPVTVVSGPVYTTPNRARDYRMANSTRSISGSRTGKVGPKNPNLRNPPRLPDPVRETIRQPIRVATTPTRTIKESSPPARETLKACKARPKDNSPKKGGSGGGRGPKKFIPWCS